MEPIDPDRFWTVEYEKVLEEEDVNEFLVFSHEKSARAFSEDVYGRVYESDKDGNAVSRGTGGAE